MRAGPDNVPFRSAEQAWFWTMGALLRRRDGGGVGGDGRKICTPDDIVTVLDELFRDKRISPSQVQVLRYYGEKHVPPAPRTEHAALWRDAMVKLQAALERRDIVQRRQATVQ